MKKIQSQLTLALLFEALFLLVFVATANAGGFIFDRLVALRQVRTFSQWAGMLAEASFLAIAAILAVRAALQPAGRWRKLLNVLPGLFLGLLLAGIVFNVVGIGTLGGFTNGWLAVSTLLAVVTLFAIAIWPSLGATSLKAVLALAALTGALGLLAWLGTIFSLFIALTSPGGGRPGGGGPGGFGGPGGPGGGTTPLLVGGALLTIFLALAVVMLALAWRARSGVAAMAGAPAGPPLNYRREITQAVISGAIVTAICLAAIQLVPISHTNPPEKTPPQWASPQDQQLFNGACRDCHSDETVYPWYAYIAPGSWLLASHIRAAHRQWNLSDLNSLSPNARNDLPNRIRDALQNDIMPPKDYRLMHPAANLDEAQKAQLIQALQFAISK